MNEQAATLSPHPKRKKMSETFENYTPHAVKVSVNGVATVYESKGVARVAEEQSVVGAHAGIELRKTTYKEILGLPTEQPGVKYIVSLVVLQANAKLENPRTDLVAPDSGRNCIRDKDGKIEAVTGFNV